MSTKPEVTDSVPAELEEAFDFLARGILAQLPPEKRSALCDELAARDAGNPQSEADRAADRFGALLLKQRAEGQAPRFAPPTFGS